MIQTQRLYYEDAFMKEFDATVTDAFMEADGTWRIILDRTAFYPEGGGQAADTGMLTIDGINFHVFDVHEKGGQVLHYVKEDESRSSEAAAESLAGKTVHGTLDWDDRFDRMQNHSGEHIVSGLIHARYGYENVGFHMGREFTVIDFSGPLTMEQLQQIEYEANALIWADVPTDIHVYDQSEIGAVSYRSKKELTGDVRIVSFPGGDVCACCGTHVRSTGQIGVIKIFSCVPFHDGVRVEMLCGRRAYQYLADVWKENHEVSVALSARPLETGKAVSHVKEVLADTTYHMISLQEKLTGIRAEKLKDAGSVVLFEDGYSPEQVRRLCTAVMETCGGAVLVLSGTDETGYKYAIGESGGDLRETVKGMNAALGGRGGGKPFFAQGSVSAGRREITDWLQKNLPDYKFM